MLCKALSLQSILVPLVCFDLVMVCFISDVYASRFQVWCESMFIRLVSTCVIPDSGDDLSAYDHQNFCSTDVRSSIRTRYSYSLRARSLAGLDSLSRFSWSVGMWWLFGTLRHINALFSRSQVLRCWDSLQGRCHDSDSHSYGSL